jgi:hypothetical protein
MLALKKKREKEKKEAEEAAKNEATAAASPADVPGGQVSLFGIGGKKKTKKGEAEKNRKSPGEIRIQKGNFLFATNLQDALNQSHVSQILGLPPICRYWRIRWWQSSND